MIATLLASLGLVIAIVSMIPYVVDIFRGGTKPSRVGYGVSAVSSTVTAWSHFSAGATRASWLTGFFAVAALTIFVLSIKRGASGGHTLDWAVLLVTAGAIAMWVAFGPRFALAAGLLAEVGYYAATIGKTIRVPRSENALAWFLTIFAGACSFAAGLVADGFDLLLLAPPLLTIAGSIAVSAILRWQRGNALRLPRKRPAPAVQPRRASGFRRGTGAAPASRG